MLECHCPVDERLSQVEQSDSDKGQHGQLIDFRVGNVIRRITTDERRVCVLDTIHASQKRLGRRSVGTAEDCQCSWCLSEVTHNRVYLSRDAGLRFQLDFVILS